MIIPNNAPQEVIIMLDELLENFELEDDPTRALHLSPLRLFEEFRGSYTKDTWTFKLQMDKVYDHGLFHEIAEWHDDHWVVTRIWPRRNEVIWRGKKVIK